MTCLRGGERLAYIERIKLPIRARWREGHTFTCGSAERTSPSNPGRSSASATAYRERGARLIGIGLQKYKDDDPSHGDIQPDREVDACKTPGHSEPTAQGKKQRRQDHGQRDD